MAAVSTVILALLGCAGPALASTSEELCATAAPVTAVAGVPYDGPVATFTDSNPLAIASDFSVSVKWGDGSTSYGTVAGDPSGRFVVTGSHTYANPGSFKTTVSIVSDGGASAVVHGHARIAAPPVVSGIDPKAGPEAGGTTVTITGTGFTHATAVQFGSTPATSFVVDSDSQITATTPAGTGTVDVTVVTPCATSATSPADQYSYAPQPVVTGIRASSGPSTGGTVVTITGTGFSGATGVDFGNTPATSFTVDSDTQITAVAPAGSGDVDVTVTTVSGSSAKVDGDRFSYRPPLSPHAVIAAAPTGVPTVLTGPPTVQSSAAAALAGSVNPQGLATTAHFEFGLDSRYRAATSAPIYDASTPDQAVGSDFSGHDVLASLSGLVPNALYHARLVATNSAGTTFGPDATFITKADVAPPPPTLGSSFNVAPVSGLVLVSINGKLVPLTEVRQIPSGTQINALRGTLKLITATGKRHKTQNGTFGGAVFTLSQLHTGKNSGRTTLALVEGTVKGAPSYAGCTTGNGLQASVAAVSKKILQLLHASDNHGNFRTKGKYSAATVRGTVWTVADRCDGTLTHVVKGSVVVTDFVRHQNIALQAGQSYLALAKPSKHK